MIICKHELCIDTEENCKKYHAHRTTLAESFWPAFFGIPCLIVGLSAVLDVGCHFLVGTPLW